MVTSTRERRDGGAQGDDPGGKGGRPITAASRRNRRRAVALSGTDSFLGRNLVGWMEEDDSVGRIIALDVVPPRTAGPKTRYYDVDLTHPSADARMAEIFRAEDVDTVVHAAFLASPTHAAAYAHEVEAIGTIHLLNACREAQVRRFVLQSQTMVYGAHPDNPNFLSEDHPGRASSSFGYLADKAEAEREAQRFAAACPDCAVTILRLAPIMGPTVRNFVTTWLSRRLVPTILGHDPLVQFLHELDALVAMKMAIDRGVRGVFNIVGDGVLPLSTAVKLAGRTPLPVPELLARSVGAVLWAARFADAPPDFLGFLRYLCVADGQKAKDELGFRPTYASREAVLDFGGALRMREARLLRDGS